MKSFLILSILAVLSVGTAEAQDNTSSAGAFPAAALPVSSRRDVIQNPIQLRNHGFPIKASPFTDPILSDPTPSSKETMAAPKAEIKPSSERGPSNLAD